MTLAVCLQCSEFKRGAFTPCPKCGYAPQHDKRLTKHVRVTDHQDNSKALKGTAARVQSQQPVKIDPEALITCIRKAQMDVEWKHRWREYLFLFAAILPLFLGIIWVIISLP